MKPALGVCYYPEQWPERLWKSDARRMVETGISWVRVGEFAWGRIEPTPGDIHLGWLLRAMDCLHASGLKVLVGTPTAAPPRWVVAKMPDMLQVDQHGQTRTFGSRRHYCFSHAGYREECAHIVTVIAQGVKDHPALSAWQIDNEFGCHDTTLSFSAAALMGFRGWLKSKYATIDALNAAWGNVFWSMEYSDFEEIDFPNRTPAEASPSHWMDFRRFSSHQVISFSKVQADVIRAITPNIPITHNYMPGMTAFDHHRIGRDLDFSSWDSYPLGNMVDRGSPARQSFYARQGFPDFQAFHHDLYRSVGRGRFWVMEQQPGPVNWAAHNYDPLPGMVRLWSWEAFAHGAETVSYFRWRQLPYAQEQMHAGLLRPDDQPAPATAEVRKVADEMKSVDVTAPAQPSDCAILFDYESCWAWDVQPQSDGFGHLEATLAVYRHLRKLALDVDILPPEIEDLSGYKLVFLPALFAWNPKLISALSRFDGLAVIGPRSGSKTRDFHIPDHLPPDLPPHLLDVKVVRVEGLADSTPVAVKGGGHVVKWREKIETRANVLMESHDGWPVLVRQQRFFCLAALLDDEALRTVTRRLVQFAGLKSIVLPEGLRTRRAGDTTFIFNYGLDEHDLESLGFKRPFGLDGSRIGPAGVATARAHPR
jgi:beta-galactosidase